MFLKDNDNPIAPIRSDNYTRTALVLTVAGVILIGLVSVIYDSIFDVVSLAF